MHLNHTYLNGYPYFLLLNDRFIKKILNVTIFYVHSAYAGYLIWHVWICVQLNQQDCMTTLQGNFTLIHTWKYPTRTLSLTTLLKLHFPTPGIFQNGEYLSGEALSDNTSVVGNDSRNPQRQTRGIYSTMYNTIPRAKATTWKPLTNPVLFNPEDQAMNTATKFGNIPRGSPLGI